MTAPLTQGGHIPVRQSAAEPATGLFRRGRLPSPGLAVRLAVIGIVVVLVWKLIQVLLLLFFAALLATVVRGAAGLLARRLHASVRWMLVLVSVGLTAIVIGAAYWIGPALASQASDLMQRLGTEWQSLQSHFNSSPIAHAITGGSAGKSGSGGAVSSGVMSYVFTVATSTIDVITALFVVIVLSLYFAFQPDMYVNGIVALTPPAHRALTRSVLLEIGHNLRLWSAGQLVDMFTVGGLAAIGLYLLGVPVPFALATLAGLLTVVPYFGALAAGVPGVLVALTQSFAAALWVVVIFVICHVVEGYVVAPLVQRHMVEMPPAVIIVSISIAAMLFGPLGIILGAPLAVAALVLVKRVYIEHILGGGAAVRGSV